MQRIEIAFVDDTDSRTSREEHEQNMEQSMDQRAKLHEATSGKTQQDKLMFHCWTWCYCDREIIKKQVEVSLVVHRKNTRFIQIKTSTRILGVHLASALK